jgi:hypothetical protein
MRLWFPLLALALAASAQQTVELKLEATSNWLDTGLKLDRGRRS